MRYIINEDNTATDTKTGLIWQRTISPNSYTWGESKKYAAAIGNGWRLPAIEELFALADHTRVGPAIDVQVFPNTTSETFWSSSLNALYRNNAWGVHFSNGHSYYGSFDNTFRVRCVRCEASCALLKPLYH